ncbi:hypothetical protein V2J09_004763 [Rumex salicifolius]
MDPGQLHRIYHKTLTNTDVKERLAFPVRHIGHIWGPHDPRDKSLRVVDRFGEVWELEARMRWDPQGHQKPEVCGRKWKRFVELNRLKPGDELTLYGHPDPNANQVTFVVSLKREITLMGQTFSGHIGPLSS